MPNEGGPMACPVDGATLVMSERAGIEIDYCPQCRGVWLDRGELDKIIERSAASFDRDDDDDYRRRDADYRRDDDYPRRDDNYQPQQGTYKKKKRGGFLEDLFDFG